MVLLAHGMGFVSRSGSVTEERKMTLGTLVGVVTLHSALQQFTTMVDEKINYLLVQ